MFDLICQLNQNILQEVFTTPDPRQEDPTTCLTVTTTKMATGAAEMTTPGNSSTNLELTMGATTTTAVAGARTFIHINTRAKTKTPVTTNYPLR